MMLAYKYRLYPNKEQEQRLTETLETCRRTYNDALAERITTYKTTGKSITYVSQMNALVLRKNEWQQRVYSQVIQDTLRRLDRSFRFFFHARRKHRSYGFPRFKPAQCFTSFCYPQRGFKISENNTNLFLSKIGEISITLHREPQGRIKTCSVIKDVDRWYAMLVCETEHTLPSTEFSNSTIGVDLGINPLLTLSTGEVIDNPRYLRRSERKLARIRKQFSRKKKGSKNHSKARIKVARCHRKVKSQRQDFLHKLSHRLVGTYHTIVFEKLNIMGMVKNHSLAKHIQDAAWSRLIHYTTYKAERAGGRVELVDPYGTSQECSGCGNKVPKTLAMRVHSCPSCGLVLDRDHNAALNILSRLERPGLRVEAV